MKKAIILFMGMVILVLPAILALNVNVQSGSQNLVLVKELNNPVSFNVSITNNGPSDNFNVYNLIGFSMTPSNKFYISSGDTKTINVTITPLSELSYNGYYSFNYFVQNSEGDRSSESVTFTIVQLKDMFTVGSSDINPQSDSATVYIRNNYNYNFKDLDASFKSPFFSFEKKISLGPHEEKTFTVPLNRNDFKNLLAGFYTISAQVNVDGKTANIEGNMGFSQKSIVNVSEHGSGFIIYKKTIEKTNTGNVVADSQTVVRKNIISRLFTTFSPEPDVTERQGLNIYYTWTDKIQPGDTFKITVSTNWLLPFFAVLLVVAIVILVKQFSKTDLTMSKKVSFLRAKGGEFAVKVTIAVNAKRFVEKLTITDRLPPLVKLYEKFGTERPSRVDEKNKKIEWYFDNLESGETRVLNYVIYSKVGVLGRFALPTATAIYERNGKISEAESNRAFLVAEQSKIRED